MRLGLRYRLLFPLAGLLAADAAATGWAVRSAVQSADDRIAGQLRAVARTLTEPPTFPLTPRVLEQMKGLSGAEFLLSRPPQPPTGTFPDPPADLPIVGDGTSTLGPPVAVCGAEYRFLALPLHPPHPNAGGTLFIFYPEALRRTAAWDAARPLLLLGGVAGLVAVALTVGVAGGLVRRVRALDRQARAIADGDFTPNPPPSDSDELGDLARSVNGMARRLAEYRDALAAAERLRVIGQFSSGLAHQLRNAAAGAKLALQLHRDECPAADREPMEVALRQLARIEATIQQFLTLGRPPDGVRKPCDLRRVIGEAVELLRPQCRHTGTRLVWDEPSDPLTVEGDAAQLGHLFGNLLGNAVDAAGPDGTVELLARRASKGFAVEIIDTGPGPPPELADRMFDPFVTGKDQGIGLGLAVAKRAAAAHGAAIAWTRRDGRTVFAVEWPG